MQKQKLENLIKDFSLEKLNDFLWDANFAVGVQNFEPLYPNSEDIFSVVQKLGEIKTDDNKRIIVAVAKVRNDLSERSSRKKQYDLGKKILDNHLNCQAGIFVFYDKQGSFRFSLIYPTYEGTKRVLNSFKRYTYFVSKEQTNKTFLSQIGDGDFSTLEKIKDAFSVEKVTKEFFVKISNWYFWAVENILFPEDAEKDKDGRNSIGAIRLITRIIFIWFMKEKKLVPDYLFNEDKVKEFLKDLSSEKSGYYKAILQNLFFATLNTPIKKRRFRKEGSYKGMNNDYDKQEFYRYEEYFKESDKIFDLFKKIPFLNGGLFECLDKKREGVIVDGFSRVKKNQPKVPNFLFFSKEREVDLNCDYGTKNKKYKVEGLINILQSYNFTVDENTLIDEEVALDPEMLGMVFENLLASYNPETSTTARKATGSYYTPRKIVDYMVDESLKAYLKNKLPAVKEVDDKLNNLFSYSDENHQFNNNEVDVLIKAINELKVIDPAVGSGAFPMGILQKLVFILSKLDPHNKKWKQEQINAVENNVSDAVLKKELIKKIESNFENNNLDYGRKLYLIQNCIYGVDIQNTAIQISKLRFFISLLVDEKSDESRENFGIEPLPNLETKFVAANSLIGLKNNGQAMLPDPRILKLEEDLKKIRAKHFNANYKSEKERLRKKDKEIRLQLAELFKQSGFPSENTEKIINWDPYSPNASADFFDSEWMFGVEGFDVVIGNPPYIKEYTKKAVFDGLHSSDYYQGKMDLWYFFGAMGLDWLKDGGIETYIAPNNWITNAGASKFRNKIISDSIILAFLDFGNYKIFESAGIQTMVYVLKKNSEIKKYSVKYGKLLNDKVDGKLLEEFINSDFNIKNDEFVKYDVGFERDKFKNKNVIFLDNSLSEIFKKIKDQANFYLTEKEVAQGIVFPQDFLNKKNQQILGNSYKIGDGVFVLSEAEKNKLNLTKKELKLTKPYYTTKQIHKWQCDLKNKEWIIYIGSKFKDPNSIKPYPNIKKHLDQFQKIITSSNKPYGLHRARDEKFFQGEKIIIARKCAEPQFCYTDFDCYVSATFYVIKTKRVDLKYLSALLNSKLIKFWLKNQGKMQGDNYQIDKEPLLNLPLKIINAKQQKPFIKLVDQILEKKKDNPEADVGELEGEIDEMVYGLYNLTEEEIKIIENS